MMIGTPVQDMCGSQAITPDLFDESLALAKPFTSSIDVGHKVSIPGAKHCKPKW